MAYNNAITASSQSCLQYRFQWLLTSCCGVYMLRKSCAVRNRNHRTAGIHNIATCYSLTLAGKGRQSHLWVTLNVIYCSYTAVCWVLPVTTEFLLLLIQVLQIQVQKLWCCVSMCVLWFYLGSAPPGKAVSQVAGSCCRPSLAGPCRPLSFPSSPGSLGVSSSAGTLALLTHDTIKFLSNCLEMSDFSQNRLSG